MSPSITIVGGCGHVGLPLGIALVNAGATVRLLDIDAAKVASVAAGVMPFLEHGAEEALARAVATGRLLPTTDADSIAASDTVLVTIGTPVDEFLDPAVRPFDRSLEEVTAWMRPDQLLVLRSTVFPGVTERLKRQLLERGSPIEVAYCPERIAQAYALEELPKLPQLVGGTTPEATRRARAVFGILGMPLLTVSPIEAELAKLMANSYRYIHFAIANQFYAIAQRFGADYHAIHAASTFQYPRLAGLPKAGFAGGPCLLKDTMQLAAFNHNTFLLGEAAMMVNEGLPRLLVDHLKAERDLSRDTVAILGMAFKGNCDDPRASLSYKLRKVLTLECREVLCTDPHIQSPEFVSLSEALERADVVFIGACHPEYKHLEITQKLVDVFQFVTPAQAARRAA